MVSCIIENPTLLLQFHIWYEAWLLQVVQLSMNQLGCLVIVSLYLIVSPSSFGVYIMYMVTVVYLQEST